MIVSPTRELAMQTHAVANPFFMGCAPGCNVVPLIGGTDVANDVAGIKNKGAAVLIGTPGRISDVLTRCTGLNFKTFEVLVLDEADRLLEMGFRTQIDSIMAKLPRQRRTGLFSATQTVCGAVCVVLRCCLHVMLSAAHLHCCPELNYRFTFP